MRKMRSKTVCMSAAVAALVSAGLTTQARDLTWAGDVYGVWDLTTSTWKDASNSPATWSNTPPDNAIFGDTTSTWDKAATPNDIELFAPITVQDLTIGVATNHGTFSFSDGGGGSLSIAGNITKTANNGQPQFLMFYGPVTFLAGNHVIAMNDTPGDVPELSMNSAMAGNGTITIDNASKGYQAWGTFGLNVDSPNYNGVINIANGRVMITTNGGLGSTSAETVIGDVGTLAIGGAGTTVVSPLTIAEPIRITRNTYAGGEYARYTGAIVSANGTGNHTFTGPFVVDSTDARIQANSSQITIASNITQGTNVTSAGGVGVLSISGDTAGFVNLTGDNRGIAAGGIKLVGAELNVTNENNLGGPTAPLTFAGGYLHPVGGFLTNFGSHVINNATFNGGLDIDAGKTFTVDQALGDANNANIGGFAIRGTGTVNFNSPVNIRGNASWWDGGTVNINNSVTLGSIHLRSPVVNVNNATLTVVGGNQGWNSIGADSTGTNGGPDKATVNIIGTGQLIQTGTDDFNVSDNANTAGTLNIKDQANVQVGGTFFAGKSNGAVATINQSGNSTLNVGTATNRRSLILGSSRTLTATNVTAIGNYTMTGGTLHVTGEMQIGDQLGGVGNFTMTGGNVTTDSWTSIGRFGGAGTFDMSGGTFTNTSAGGGNAMYVGESNGAAHAPSTMTLHGNALVEVQNHEFWVGQGSGASGTLNISDTAQLKVDNNWLAIGRGGATGVVNLSGGSMSKAGNGFLAIGSGGSGTLNQTGGTLTSNGTRLGEASSGTMNITGGTATFAGEFSVGYQNNNIGTLNIGGTSGANVTVPDVVYGTNGSGANGGAINLSGNAVLTGSSFRAGSATSTGPKTFTFNGGTLRPSADNTNFIGAKITSVVSTGGANVDTNGFAATVNSALTHDSALGGADGGLTKAGNGTLTLAAANTYNGATTVNAGTLSVTGSVFSSSGVTANAGGTFAAGATQAVRKLNVNTGGLATITTSAGGTNVTALTVGDGSSATPQLALQAGGKMDINNNGLIVDVAAGGESAALTTVRTAVLAAYNGGAWNGTGGLTSSQIVAGNRLAIGFGLPGEVPAALTGGGTQFFGAPVDASAVVVQTTVGGDANLDKVVNFDDLLVLAKNYNSSTAYWSKGDFTYDGTVNFDDLLVLAKDYNASMPTDPVPGASAQFEADMAAAFAAVPEPGSLALLGIGVGALLGRRRRRNESRAD